MPQAQTLYDVTNTADLNKLLADYLRGMWTDQQFMDVWKGAGYSQESGLTMLNNVKNQSDAWKQNLLAQFPATGGGAGTGTGTDGGAGAGTGTGTDGGAGAGTGTGTDGGAGAGTGTQTTLPTGGGGWFNEPGNEDIAWNKALGASGVGLNPFQEYVQKRFNPTYATWYARSFLNPTPERQAAPQWSDYVANLGSGVGNVAGDAWGLLKQAAALPGEGAIGQNTLMTGLGSGFSSFLEEALRNRYAAPVARTLARQASSLYDQYQGNTGGQGSNFLSNLLKIYNLA